MSPADLSRALEEAIQAFSAQFPPSSFFSMVSNVHALIALVLVSLTCGAVGSLVVGGRMAFFTDAIAHGAFAGVSIGFLVFAFLAADRPKDEFWQWVLPVMVSFGVLVGFGIAYVRGHTGLANDTVIGVFFAGAIGLAAMLNKLIRSRSLFNLESFLFGDPGQVGAGDLLMLFVLTLFTAGLLALIYNTLLLTGFNPSLARSRGRRVRLCQYLFVMLLAVIVNLCLKWVGVLLINALLVVPAATAANCSRNLRQMFWGTIALCLTVSLLGQLLSWEVEIRSADWPTGTIRLGVAGTIVLLSVLLFALSMLVPTFARRSAPSAGV
jgi:zinc transport system permease protein